MIGKGGGGGGGEERQCVCVCVCVSRRGGGGGGQWVMNLPLSVPCTPGSCPFCSGSHFFVSFLLQGIT